MLTRHKTGHISEAEVSFRWDLPPSSSSPWPCPQWPCWLSWVAWWPPLRQVPDPDPRRTTATTTTTGPTMDTTGRNYKLLSYYCSSLQILRRVRPGQPLQLQHCVSQQLLQRPVHRGLRLQRQLQGESANVITCHVSHVSLWPQVVNHVAACACPAGYSGNAASSCFRL